MSETKMEIVHISEPCDGILTEDSVKWCDVDNIDTLEIPECTQTVTVTFKNGDLRKYAYFDKVTVESGDHLNLNFTYISGLSISNTEFSISSVGSIFDGDIFLKDCIITNRRFDFVKTLVRGNIIIWDIDLDMTRFMLKDVQTNMLIIKNCIIRCHLSLKSVNLRHIILNGCIIHGTCNMDVLDKSGLVGLNFHKTRIMGQVYIHWKNWIKQAILNGKYIESKGKGSFVISDTYIKQIADQFVLLKENFNNLGQYYDEDSAYVLFKRYEAKAALEEARGKNVIGKISGSIRYLANRVMFDLVGGYGTKPKSVFAAMLIIWLGFAGLYAWLPKIELKFTDSISGIDKIRPLYFSVITFLTIGYGDVSPLNDRTAILAMIEGFLGIFLMSYFTVSFVRKLLR